MIGLKKLTLFWARTDFAFTRRPLGQRDMKFLPTSLTLLIALASHAFCQPKASDGFVVVANFIPPDCKRMIDGFYRITKEDTITIPCLSDPVPTGKDLQVLRANLVQRIQIFCLEMVPRRNAFPAIDLISEADLRQAGEGVLVMGQVKEPGPVPMTPGLTLYQAIRSTGGFTEFSTMRQISVIRDKKVSNHDLTEIKSAKLLLQPGDYVSVPVRCPVSESGY